jgi:predicted nucleic acid-binding protein
MTVFADSSALFALLDAGDAEHRAAANAWRQLRGGNARLVTSNYVVVEAFSLAQRRLGMEAARAFVQDVSPLLAVEWVTPDAHIAAECAVLASGLRDLSLVDCTSFELMRRLGIWRVFAFDRHFAERGFECLP